MKKESPKKEAPFLETIHPPSLDEGYTYLSVKELEKSLKEKKDKPSPKKRNT